MVNRLKHTLRRAALEDQLHHHLGLSAGSASQLARLAGDLAGTALPGATSEQLQDGFFRIMFEHGHAQLLSRVAIESPEFTVALTRFIASESLEDQRAA